LLLAAIIFFCAIVGVMTAVLMSRPLQSVNRVLGPLLLSTRVAQWAPLLLLPILSLFRRSLLRCLVLILLGLSLASFGLWVRSYLHPEWLERHVEVPNGNVVANTQIRLTSSHGGLRIAYDAWDFPVAVPSRIPLVCDGNWYLNTESDRCDYASDPFSDTRTQWNSLGFGFQSQTMSGPIMARQDRLVELILPYWSVTLVLMLPAAGSLIRRYRRVMRLTTNHCAQCGYDLRATPDRCPECGAVQV
jgi:hypothetical protein